MHALQWIDYNYYTPVTSVIVHRLPNLMGVYVCLLQMVQMGKSQDGGELSY